MSRCTRRRRVDHRYVAETLLLYIAVAAVALLFLGLPVASLLGAF